MPRINGTDLIAEERQHQIELGYDADHDADHADELARAGACYADKAASDLQNSSIDEPHVFWPWEESSWNPGDSQLDTLVKAGALIAAAIDSILASMPEMDEI